MLINDDLHAFTQLPFSLGVTSKNSRERTFFTVLLAGIGTFFHNDNKNYIGTGGGAAAPYNALNPLDHDALGLAVRRMRTMTDPKGNPVATMPKHLLVSPESETTADSLYISELLNQHLRATKQKRRPTLIAVNIHPSLLRL